MKSSWRESAKNIIIYNLPKYKEMYPYLSKAEILSKISKECYEFGQRGYHPYKIWLSEIKRWREGFYDGVVKNKEIIIDDRRCCLF